jgi:UDP-N-acetyl-D-mannosaminuronic acid dehydrogenase
MHIFEPGVAEVFTQLLDENIHVSNRFPDESVDAAIICVSTPVDSSHEPCLENLAAAAEEVAHGCDAGTLVVVRSTVPVGATRDVVLPPLLRAWGRARVVMAPERTVQGRALQDLAQLPQVVGGLDNESLESGLVLFSRLTKRLIPVSSLETAELVKLANNCHADVTFSFGNEIAMLTDRLGLDPMEVLRAANLDFPRPDIAKPGYVGGSCLPKDPYILMSSARTAGRSLRLIPAARELNEELPVHVAERMVEMMLATEGKTILVLGWAFKGMPPTDDVRGAAIVAMVPVFSQADLRVLGHDPLVPASVIHEHGGEPVDLETGFREADAVLVVTDHPDYRALDIAALLEGSNVKVLYDSWRVLDAAEICRRGVRYAGLGYTTGDAG